MRKRTPLATGLMIGIPGTEVMYPKKATRSSPAGGRVRASVSFTFSWPVGTKLVHGSQASPRASASAFACVGFAMVGQLSITSQTPSPSASGRPASVGQLAAVPVQLSATSQGPLAGRQTVVAGASRQVGRQQSLPGICVSHSSPASVSTTPLPHRGCAPACPAASRSAIAPANANPWTLMRRLISTLSPEALRRCRLGAGVYHVGAEACQAIRGPGSPTPAAEAPPREVARPPGSGVQPGESLTLIYQSHDETARWPDPTNSPTRPSSARWC